MLTALGTIQQQDPPPQRDARTYSTGHGEVPRQTPGSLLADKGHFDAIHRQGSHQNKSQRKACGAGERQASEAGGPCFEKFKEQKSSTNLWTPKTESKRSEVNKNKILNQPLDTKNANETDTYKIRNGTAATGTFPEKTKICKYRILTAPQPQTHSSRRTKNEKR